MIAEEHTAKAARTTSLVGVETFIVMPHQGYRKTGVLVLGNDKSGGWYPRGKATDQGNVGPVRYVIESATAYCPTPQIVVGVWI